MDDLTTLTDAEARNLLARVYADVQRRDAIAQAPAQAEALAATYAAAIGRKDGDPWAQPVGAHDAYRKDAIVTHGGKTWESTTPNNVWEPGVSGWREKVADDPDGEPGVPDFAEPTGQHDAYEIGDRVRFDGKVWESTIDNNVWSPADYPAGWKLIG